MWENCFLYCPYTCPESLSPHIWLCRLFCHWDFYKYKLILEISYVGLGQVLECKLYFWPSFRVLLYFAVSRFWSDEEIIVCSSSLVGLISSEIRHSILILHVQSLAKRVCLVPKTHSLNVGFCQWLCLPCLWHSIFSILNDHHWQAYIQLFVLV